MYYAPWDAESQYVRGQFEEAAMILNDRVCISLLSKYITGKYYLIVIYRQYSPYLNQVF